MKATESKNTNEKAHCSIAALSKRNVKLGNLFRVANAAVLPPSNGTATLQGNRIKDKVDPSLANTLAVLKLQVVLDADAGLRVLVKPPANATVQLAKLLFRVVLPIRRAAAGIVGQAPPVADVVGAFALGAPAAGREALVRRVG